jgi:hypothetical protein
MVDGSITDEQAHVWLQEIAQSGWISLHYDNPGLSGEDRVEISGGGYVRFKMAWSQPSNRAIWSLVDARFAGLTQTKVTYFGVWDAQYKGFLRAYAELREPSAILTGKGFILHSGSVVVSFG